MSTSTSAKLPSVIALFGDSITVGYNADFAPELASTNANGTTTIGRPTIELNRLMKGPPLRDVIVANYGFGGTSTNNGVSRINSVLDDNTADFPGSDYYMLILYGTNDKNAGMSSTTTGFNVETIIRRAQERNYTAIVGTLLPRSDQSVTSRNFRIAIAALNRNAPLVDHFSVFNNYPGGYQDQLIDIEERASTGEMRYLHPNELGYKVIAEKWFNEELKDRIPARFTIAPILLLLLDD